MDKKCKIIKRLNDIDDELDKLWYEHNVRIDKLVWERNELEEKLDKINETENRDWNT